MKEGGGMIGPLRTRALATPARASVHLVTDSFSALESSGIVADYPVESERERAAERYLAAHISLSKEEATCRRHSPPPRSRLSMKRNESSDVDISRVIALSSCG